MEVSFLDLRAKEVVNTQDGKKLGRVCDVVLCYPENKWLGVVVPGGRGWSKKNNFFIDLRQIVKIGEDVILVNVGMPRKNGGKKGAFAQPTPPPPPSQNRSFEEYE